MKSTSRFVPAEANFLAHAAMDNRLVTCGEFAREFGLPNQCGPQLSAMCERLAANALPLLPVVVVNKGTVVPSPDAGYYAQKGMDEAALKNEQKKCFEHDLTQEKFWKDAE